MAGHTAFNSVSLVDRLPLKIECLDIWGDRIIVGTTEGVLLVYEVVEKKEEGKTPYFMKLIDDHKEFSKKPIKQLEVIEELKLLISLTDKVQVNVLGSFSPHSVLAKTKGANMFAIDLVPSTLSLRLCVAVKRKLLLYEWDGKQFNEYKELSLPDHVKTVVWCDYNLCVGYKRDYNLINVRTGATKDLFSPGKANHPIITSLPNKQLILAKDNIGIFIDYEGTPTRKFGLSWSENPITIDYSFPYVLALLPRYLEVRAMSGTQTLVQTLSLRNARLMKVKNRNIYVASQSHIWRLLPVPIMDQVDQLVREKEYEEALNLCESLTDFDEKAKSEKLRSIRKLFSYHLFCQGHYEHAMEYFFQLETDPLEVIGLYPNLLPKGMREKYEQSYPMDIPVLVGASLEKALAALINYLTQIRPSATASGNSSGAASSSTNPDTEEYSTVTDLPTIIDTALLKAYIKTDNMDLSTLLMVPNQCHVKECEKVLHNYTKYSHLVLLYKGKELHGKALSLLAKLGQGPRQGNPLHGTSETIKYLRDLDPNHLALVLEFSKWVLQTTPREGLAIFTDRSPDKMLPPDKVLAHIAPIAPSLVVPYLEFIINERDEKGATFHNELIFHYLRTVLQLKDDATYKRQTGGLIPAGTEPGLLGETRRKLIGFLNFSVYYNPEKMLSRFPFNDLFEERAILLSRIQQHQQALGIYVYKLKNPMLAEQYCVKHYNPESEESRDVFLSLLQVYLRPPPEETVQLAPALALLNKYYHSIDAPKALELLPPSCSIKQLAPFFLNVIRDCTKRRRDKLVTQNLLKLEKLQVNDELIHAKSAHVIKVTEERTCPVCHKRLGLSAFARYPNNVVVHYNCCKDRHVCPVTGTRFKKGPFLS
ncbi:Vam6/Vps39-like protein [Balamuthia mandrillaris]